MLRSLPEALKHNAFCQRFYNHLQQNELVIPQLPEVALKLRRVIQNDVGTAEVVKIINLDPFIAARLIQVVNSPLYRTLNPITTCLDAVNRLGLKTTANLVMAFSMKNLATCKKTDIKKQIQQTWLHSVKISSISHALAEIAPKIDQEEALLAGLLHNIGALPILMFADGENVNSYQLSDLVLCINHLQNYLGRLVLEKWELPDNFKFIPTKTAHWFANNSAYTDLNDIVILAKYHNELSANGGINLPLINTLPAFQKLENKALTPELSLSVLRDAKQQIAETMRFFTS